MQKGNILRKLYAKLRQVNLLYASFTPLYAALRTLRKAKTPYATLRTWQLADGLPGQHLLSLSQRLRERLLALLQPPHHPPRIN